MKKILFDKRGMFFTLLTIFLLGIFIFYFITNSYQRNLQKKEVVEKRVLSIDDFLNDVKRDLERGLYISGYRSLLAMNEHLINKHAFIDDVETEMKEGILNGTINGSASALLIGSTFPNWIEKIVYQGDKLKITINITLLNLTVYQQDPWFVTVGANVSFVIFDEQRTATFSQQDFLTTDISIIGFEDPVYIMNGYGRLTNVINKTPYEGNFTYQQGNGWNVTRLLTHTKEGYYSADPDAPSFLQRFENDYTASPYGIESLTDLAKFSSQGLPIYDYSIVDHNYFINASTTNYRVNFTPSWFKIDNSHRAKYGVTAISYLE